MIYGILLAAATAAPCAAAQTQLALDACWAARATHADSELNATAARADAEIRKLGADSNSLAAVQTAWVAARDATCGFETSLYEGGSIAPMIASECADRMTRARNARLQAMLDALSADRTPTPAKPASPGAAGKLERFYELLSTRITLPQQRLLASSERAWTVYREKACHLEGGNCPTELDRERVVELEDGWIGEQFW
jgi:uncharacterized protein YecT (DUF1311 family)